MKTKITERLEQIEKGIVPEGYKDTKIGIIPVDWEVKKLGEVGEFFRGKGIPKSEIREVGVDCIIYGEIYTIYNFFTKELDSKVDSEVADNSTEIEYGDLLFTSSGETSEAIGKCIMYLGNNRAVAGGDIVVMRPKNIIKNKVYSYLLNSQVINKQKYKLGQGHSVVHLYSSQLNDIKLPIIPLEEQQEIANILSTWDKAIENIEKLIKEKEIQKKGLMQELLTGETRLPGFTGEWEEVKLGEVTKIETGNKDNKDNDIEGAYPFYVRSETIIKIDSYSYDGEAILIPGDGRIGEIYHYINGKFDYHQRVYKISDFHENTMGKYIFYYFKEYFYRQAMKYTSKATVDSLRMEVFKDFILNLPSLPEQKAIAEILSTADKEIKLLNQLLENKKEEKKGLMQLLLTGIVRV